VFSPAIVPRTRDASRGARAGFFRLTGHGLMRADNNLNDSLPGLTACFTATALWFCYTATPSSNNRSRVLPTFVPLFAVLCMVCCSFALPCLDNTCGSPLRHAAPYCGLRGQTYRLDPGPLFPDGSGSSVPVTVPRVTWPAPLQTFCSWIAMVLMISDRTLLGAVFDWTAVARHRQRTVHAPVPRGRPAISRLQTPLLSLFIPTPAVLFFFNATLRGFVAPDHLFLVR